MFDGSSIIMVWYSDFSKNKTIEEIIQSELEKFDWNRHAENFNF